jgi:hypothetical protein
VTTADLVSDCCGVGIRVVGDTTQHWECLACGNPCNAVPEDASEWADDETKLRRVRFVPVDESADVW